MKMAKLPKGVSLTGTRRRRRAGKGRYQSRIFRDGRSLHLGVFDSVDEAAAVYQAAKKQPIATPPATAPEPPPTPPPQPPIPAPAEPRANLKPPPKAFPPGTCPNDGEQFRELGGARRCAVCGCQLAMWNAPSFSRADYAAGNMGRRPRE